MIKIRYRDADELSPGLHAAAVPQGRNTIVFLLPGLTVAERRAALRRLRLSARMGYCPPLPPAQLAFALVADRIRTTVGQLGTLVRSHPAGSTVPVMVISAGAIAFLALSAVSIQVLHLPGHPARPSSLAGAGDGSATWMPRPSPSQASQTPGQGGPTGSVGPGVSTSPAARPSRRPHPIPSATTGSAAAATPGAVLTPSPPPGDPVPSPSPPSSQADPQPATASTSASPAMQRPSPTPTASSTCIDVGPLGICP